MTPISGGCLLLGLARSFGRGICRSRRARGGGAAASCARQRWYADVQQRGAAGGCRACQGHHMRGCSSACRRCGQCRRCGAAAAAAVAEGSRGCAARRAADQQRRRLRRQDEQLSEEQSQGCDAHGGNATRIVETARGGAAVSCAAAAPAGGDLGDGGDDDEDKFASCRVNLQVSTVKLDGDPSDRSLRDAAFAFRLLSPGGSLMLQAESGALERDAWVAALQGVTTELITAGVGAGPGPGEGGALRARCTPRARRCGGCGGGAW